MSEAIRGQKPQDPACYKESCVSKRAVVTLCAGWCGAEHGICPIRSPLQDSTIQESYCQVPEAGSESRSEQARRPGTPGTMVPGWKGSHRPGGRKETWGKRKGGDPLPSKTEGLQPPEAGDVSTDVPLGPPSAHTWGPREDKDGCYLPTPDPIYSVLNLPWSGVATEPVISPTLEI